MTTSRLEDRWADYYRKGWEPASNVDRWRVLLLAGKLVPSPESPGQGAALSAEITKMERLGYDVERTKRGDRIAYQITNPTHRPSAEQFAAMRAAPAKASRSGNGTGTLASMLPALGEQLTVTMVGFDPDGGASFVVSSEAGWRYSCAVTRTEAPREHQ